MNSQILYNPVYSISVVLLVHLSQYCAVGAGPCSDMTSTFKDIINFDVDKLKVFECLNSCVKDNNCTVAVVSDSMCALSNGLFCNSLKDSKLFLRNSGAFLGAVIDASPIMPGLPDSAFSAKSVWSSSIFAYHSRIDNVYPGSWGAATSNNQWIQIDMQQQKLVMAVATRGHHKLAHWVTAYRLMYSCDDVVFADYEEMGTVKQFAGNFDNYAIVKHDLAVPFVARVIRLHPLTWTLYPDMRWEVYGLV